MKLGFNTSTSCCKIIVPSQNIPPSENIPGIAWCGWKKDSEYDWWGAIWQYQDSPNFVDISQDLCDFKVDGNYESYNVNAYKFMFSENGGVWQVTWSNPTTIPSNNIIYSNTEAITTIKVPNVDENPTFLLFESN